MFRPNREDLVDDLVTLLMNVFRGNGHPITVNGQQITIERDQNGGDFGDCVFLSHTVNEYAKPFGANPPRPRLPVMVREHLMRRGVNIFNPRGRSLKDINGVQQLLGIMLECIDPPSSVQRNGVHQDNLRINNRLRREAQRYLDKWRHEAREFIVTNPSPNTPHSLRDFVSAWQSRTPQGLPNWPSDWPLLELCFKIIAWIPMFYDDPEGQVYLEAIARCIAQSTTYSSYQSAIYHGRPPHDDRSVERAILDIFVPIAEGAVEVDEDIMPNVPRSYLPLMTIHQAKGLEYPFVIVDISSDYSQNNVKQRFRRFPENPSSVQELENDLAPHCPIGQLRLARGALQRTFDDLTRLYYVAYSRPHEILLLVGLDACLRYSTSIRHVATGWRSDSSWSWITPVTGRLPAMANNIPIHLI
jgi:DNA helicase-2/ATP-dependent DNA helicase PcrA